MTHHERSVVINPLFSVDTTVKQLRLIQDLLIKYSQENVLIHIRDDEDPDNQKDLEFTIKKPPNPKYGPTQITARFSDEDRNFDSYIRLDGRGITFYDRDKNTGAIANKSSISYINIGDTQRLGLDRDNMSLAKAFGKMSQVYQALGNTC